MEHVKKFWGPRKKQEKKNFFLKQKKCWRTWWLRILKVRECHESTDSRNAMIPTRRSTKIASNKPE